MSKDVGTKTAHKGLKLIPVHMSTAAPKSIIFTSPLVVISTLSGLTCKAVAYIYEAIRNDNKLEPSK